MSRHPRGFRHDRLRRRLSEFLDGTLDAATASELEHQLARCSACRDELEALRDTVHLLQAMGGAAPPRDLSDRVMARIEAGEADPPWSARAAARLSGFFDSSFGAPLATGAAALLVFAVVQDVDVAIQLPDFGTPQAVVAAPLASAPSPARRPEASDRLRGLGGSAASRTPGALALAERNRRELSRAATPAPEERPMASMEDCLQGHAGAGNPDCGRWHAFMVELALRDARAFLAEVDSVPRPARDRWIGEISRFASDAGSAPLLAHELRATGDPRASRLAPRFERAGLSSRR